MHHRRLELLKELEGFQRRFLAHSGINVPLDYFQQSIVTGVFDERHMLVGGYATAPGASGRWLSQIPDVATLCARVPVDRTLELNSVWLDPRLQGTSASSDFWIAIGDDLARRPVDHIVFAANTRKRGLVRLYRKIAVGILYEGPIVNSSLPSARFYYSTPERFARLRHLYELDLRARVGTNRRRHATDYHEETKCTKHTKSF
jgi:hypothetical protein